MTLGIRNIYEDTLLRFVQKIQYVKAEIPK